MSTISFFPKSLRCLGLLFDAPATPSITLKSRKENYQSRSLYAMQPISFNTNLLISTSATFPNILDFTLCHLRLLLCKLFMCGCVDVEDTDVHDLHVVRTSFSCALYVLVPKVLDSRIAMYIDDICIA